MKMRDLLAIESIDLNAKPKNKKDAIEMAVDLMCKSGKINDKAAYTQYVFAREEESTTGVGDKIAIPHGRGVAVTNAGLAAMVIPAGVEFESLDDQEVELLFLIAAPETKDNIHLSVLSKLSRMLMHEEFVQKLKQAKTTEEFLNVLDEADNTEEVQESNDEENSLILAVTACPTGIAHTYMAAESLEKAAKKAGVAIKIETRGSGGAKNVITDEEIEKAIGVIVAADADVPMERFHGKKLIDCQVSDGIKKADQLIEKIKQGDASIYRSSSQATKSSSKSSGSAGHKIYTQLMSGVSQMLPFVVGGGILIAIAFLIDGLSIDINALPAELRGNFGSITPLAAMFKNIGGAAFGLMLPVLAGFIAMSIGDRPALALGFVGGFMAANGTSGFLGALVAGFLAGYIVVALRKLFDKLPATIEKLAPVLLYPVLGLFILGVAMIFLIEPPVGALNTALNAALSNMGGTSKILLGLVLGSMMAIDMGGPFNKAAYVFGTAAITAGNYDIMAAVMIGGMVPPCAIALSTLLFKKKFTKEEKESGVTNFVMGLAFITEGAIPFAASDPLRVIPACMIGSGIAGALSMAFGCTLMAPHGGIFVFPVVGGGLMYLVALVVGTISGALLLGLLKKNIEE